MDTPLWIKLGFTAFATVSGLLSSIVLASWASFLRRREAEETERLKHEEARDERVSHMEYWLVKNTTFEIKH